MIDQTEFITVCGKIPFCVLLEDSISPDDQYIESNAVPIVAEDGSYVAEMYLRKTIRPGSGIASEDLFGELTYSVFSLIFKRVNTQSGTLTSVFSLKDGKFDHDHVMDVATALVHRFVFIYKSVWGHDKDWLPTITKIRLSPWTITVLDSAGKKLQGPCAIDHRGTGIMIGNNASPEQLDMRNSS